MKPITNVVLVDDHPIFREGVKQVLDSTVEYNLFFEANTIEEMDVFLAENHTRLPELLFILDLSLQDGTGFDLIQMIVSAGGQAERCCILSMHRDAEYAAHTFSMGALGYVVKSDDADCIIDCLNALSEKEYYTSPAVDKDFTIDQTEIKVGDIAPLGALPRTEQADFSQLSKREVAVLKLVAEGKTSKEISKTLFLSPRTVENHRAKICRKLGVFGPNGLLSHAVKYKKVISNLD